ncbi:hypothetical protein [Tranquillimonas alkanivorans]|uniref:hypothetical protein n=1 Tax=Tranquillimonas alkanivorans TaxID=441119 RepID=UPI000B822A60|nr:hypothetical protein [Tranquillimonas alkanivorans]
MIAKEAADYWHGAAEARALTGREGVEVIASAIERIEAAALHAAPPVAMRAMDTLEYLSASGPTAVVREAAVDALRWIRAPR